MLEVLFITVLSLIFRIPALFQSFWLDEAAQATLSKIPPWNLSWSGDFQPPLFYLLSYFWQSFGNNSEWFLRILPLFFGVLTILIMHKLIKKMFGSTAAILTSIFLSTSSFHIYYSTEYRMYSLFCLLSVISWSTLYSKRYFLYALSIAAALYTHYFSILIIISQIIYMLLTRKKSIGVYLKYLAVGISPFLFWIPTMVSQIATSKMLLHAWPGWSDVAGSSFIRFPILLFSKFTVGMISPVNKIYYALVVVIFGVIFLISLIGLFVLQKNKNRQFSFCVPIKNYVLLCWFFVPFLIAWFSGLVIRVNSPHRLILLLPAYFCILVLGVMKIKIAGIKIALIGSIIFISFLSSFQFLTLKNYQKEDWRSAIQYTDNYILKNNGIVLSKYVSPWAPMKWYSKKYSQYVGVSNTITITDLSIDQTLKNIVYKHNHIAVYRYLFELSDPENRVENYLQSNNYKLNYSKDFRGVGIIDFYER